MIVSKSSKMKIKSASSNKASGNPVKSKVIARGEEISSNLKVVDIDSITPWEKNPKKYKDKIDELVVSIKQYGQRKPLTVWTKNNVIYTGNNTWYAMKKLKYEKIAVLFEEFRDEKEAIGWGLIENKSGENQEWDQGKLAALLQGETFQGLKSDEIAMLTGFKDKDMKSLLLSTAELPDVLPDVDLDGGVPDKADFIVIQFESRPAMQKFKERLGFETKHPRVVPYADLLKVMSWTEKETITSIPEEKTKKKLLLKKR